MSRKNKTAEKQLSDKDYFFEFMSLLSLNKKRKFLKKLK